MKTYRYTCLDTNGYKVRGVLDASSVDKARSVLVLRGLSVVSILPYYFGAFSRSRLRRNMILFFSEWRAFQSFGLSEGQAMDSMAKDPKLVQEVRDWSRRVSESLRSGISLEQALMIIGIPLEVALTIDRGAAMGKLSETLQAVLKREEELDDIKRTWFTALFYPAMVTVFIFLMGVVSVVWLIPMQEDMFMRMARGNPDKIPPISSAIFYINKHLPVWFLYLLLLGAVVLATHQYARIKYERYVLWLSALWSNLPYMGTLHYLGELGGYLRTLAVAYSVGFSVQEALNTATLHVRGAFLLQKLKKVQELVSNGECNLAEAFERTEVSPGLDIIVRRGEFGGRDSTAKALVQGADFFSTRIQMQLEKLRKIASFAGDILVYVIGAPVMLALVFPQYEAVQMMLELF